jgi:membrane protease YdiL (CAAX protease family)
MRAIIKKITYFIILYIFIIGTFTYLGGQLIGVDLGRYSADHSHTTLLQTLVLTIFEFIGTLLTIWIFLKYIDKKTLIPTLQGVSYHDIRIGLLISFMVMISGFISLLVTNQIGALRINFNGLNIILSVFIFLLAAIMEEVLVRWLVLRNLLTHFRKWIALSMSAVIFSLLHFLNPHIDLVSAVNLFLAGILLGLPFVYTRNLWCSISLHFGWNLFQSFLGFNVSGLTFYSLIIQGTNAGNRWTGASFGFEGSYLCLILQLIAILIVNNIYTVRSKNTYSTSVQYQQLT